MKKIIALIASAVLLLGCLVPAAFAEDDRFITVKGSATVLTDADSANVMLGVVSSAKEASEASRLNAEMVDRLITALGEIGIAERDISTNYYYVSPRFNYDYMDEDGNYALNGYQVDNTLSVMVRDVGQIGTVIDLAFANGANSCNGITFATSAASGAQDEALKAAVREAERRAAIIAEACGKKLGDILNVKEDYSSSSLVINNKRTAGEAQEASMDAAATQIMSDGLSFMANVEVTFELKG